MYMSIDIYTYMNVKTTLQFYLLEMYRIKCFINISGKLWVAACSVNAKN